MSLSKSNVKALFQDYLKVKSSATGPIYASLKDLSLSEQLIFIDIIVSYELFKVHSLDFDFDLCFDEVANVSCDVLVFVDDNDAFFRAVYTDINSIINDKKNYKTKFDLGFKAFDTLVYLNILIKSIHFVNNFLDDDNVCGEDNMLHRNVVMSNILGYSQAFILIRKGSRLKSNCSKLIMLLHKYVATKKITLLDKASGRNRAKVFKTQVYIKFNILSPNSYRDRLVLKYGASEFRILDEYLVCSSYLTLCEHTSKSIHQHFKNKINTSAVWALSKKPIEIDYSLWGSIYSRLKNDLVKSYNLSQSSLNSDIGVSLIVDQLKKLMEAELRKVEEVTSLDGRDPEYVMGTKDDPAEVGPKVTKTALYLKLEKDVQRLFYTLIIEKAAKLAYPIYTAHYYDFRGRIYPNSAVSFMYLKLVRPLFVCRPSKSSGGTLLTSRYYNKILNSGVTFSYEIENSIKNEIDRYYMAVLFLEMGKLHKSKLIIKEGVNLQSFIDQGYKLFNQDENDNIDTEDLSYYLSVKRTINSFLEAGVWANTTVIRDSTASAFQHWGRALGIKEEYREKLNLGGSTWHDIYTVIINLFLSDHNEFGSNELLRPVLTRKYLKSIAMISTYNAGKEKCLEEFLKGLKEAGIYDESSYMLYKTLIYRFHAFLTDGLFEKLYIREKAAFLEATKNNITLKDARLSLSYYETIDEKEVVKIKDERWIFNLRRLQTDVSHWKTKVALNANIIQAYDAELARYLITECNVWPVHDSFAISLFELHILMDATCDFFSERLGHNAYCTFILI